MSEPTVICVIGTPRSGTSLTARILNLAGVYLGPKEEMVKPGRWNPAGFWENRRLVTLNRRLLRSLGDNRLAPASPPAGWAESEELSGAREEARALLDELFGGRARWGWKEPGAAVTLPFWQFVAPPMRYVICVRNPVDIAASAAPAKGLSAEEVLAAWPRRVAAALANTAGRRRMFVAYDDYLHSRRQTVERLWRFAGNEGNPSEEQARRLEAPIEESLLRHRTPPAETLRDDALPAATRSMYLMVELLRRAAGERASAVEEAVDAYAARMLDDGPQAAD